MFRLHEIISIRMKYAIHSILSATILSITAIGCRAKEPVEVGGSDDAVITVKKGFACGADVSWITEMESQGIKFYTPDSESKEMECMRLLRDYCGVNSIRLRVWVNPDKPWNGIQDVVVKAKRAHSLGQRLMIDFHFSDYWADPGKQVIPKAWADLEFAELLEAEGNHVKEVLSAIKKEGVDVEWVQIGNETTPGMMHPVGTIEHPKELTALNNAGYDAVKSIYPTAKCIVHLDGGHDQWRYDRMFDLLEQHGGKYDMIGMSVYPYWAEQSGEAGGWKTNSDKCLTNIAHLRAKYNKPIMICEIGMPYDQMKDCKALIAKMMGSDIEGIFYWEPEAPPGYNNGYNLGCFLNGKPTIALDPFKNRKER